MLYNQTGSTVWLFKGHPIAAWGSSDVPKWLAESPGVKALIAEGTLGVTSAVPPAQFSKKMLEFLAEEPAPAKKSGKKGR